VRVNLIRSILVFREKKYYLHDNAKLVFLKIYIYENYTHCKKKKSTRIVQVNCTVHVNNAIDLHCSLAQCKWIALCTRPKNFKKQSGVASPNSRAERELAWAPSKLNSVFDITKYHVCSGCFKRRSNQANKRPRSQLKTQSTRFWMLWGRLKLSLIFFWSVFVVVFQSVFYFEMY